MTKKADHKTGRVVIFDFDGTIADTFTMSVHIFETMTKRPEPYPTEEVEKLRGMSGLQLIRELDLKPLFIPFMLAKGRAMMRHRLLHIKLFPGIKDIIADLDHQGVRLYIMSSNSPANIRKFLGQHGMVDHFKRIYGNVGLFGKARALRRVMRQNRLLPEQVTYVGDEARDVEGAKHAGVRIVAVTWGFNSAELLANHQPDVLAHTTAELEQALRQ